MTMTLTPLTTILTMTLSENDADSNNNADNNDANDYDADDIAKNDDAGHSNADQDASLPDWACCMCVWFRIYVLSAVARHLNTAISAALLCTCTCVYFPVARHRHRAAAFP